MAYIQGEDRHQMIMIAETIDDYITEENAVRIIDEFVEQLNLKDLGFKLTDHKGVGRPPYKPSDLLKLYLYGYLNRIRSSRRLENETTRNLEVIWLLNKLRPDFKTIADFRKNNKKALKNVFREFTKLCSNWDLFGKEMVAIDGTKIKASNSKRNNYNLKKLDRHIKYINEKIEKYMEELDENDEAENVDRKLTKEEVKEKIKVLRERKMNYEQKKEKLKEPKIKEISTTDPDAPLMNSNNNGIDVSYNVQTTVDSKNKR